MAKKHNKMTINEFLLVIKNYIYVNLNFVEKDLAWTRFMNRLPGVVTPANIMTLNHLAK